MKQLKEQLANTVQEVLDGNFNPLEAYIEFKQLSDHLKECIEQVYDSALEEAVKNNKQQFNGYLIEVANGKKTYSYKNNKKWNFLKAELNNFELELKNRLNNTDGFSEDTGEVFENLPEVKISRDSIRLKTIK